MRLVPVDSPRFAALASSIRQIAASPDTPVLIVAEPGCGADDVAEAIHAAAAPIARRYVAVRCRGVPEASVHRDLFGGDARRSEPRAAVARARPGTVFIEEVAELGGATQAALAAFIEGERAAALATGGAGRVRIVAATTTALDEAARARRFLPELLDQLSVVRLRIPPLRERPEDIVRLARAFVAQRARLLGKPLGDLTPGAEAKLAAHPFPGNELELGRVIERAAIVETGPAISPSSITFDDGSLFRPANDGGAGWFEPASGPPPTLEQLERAYIVWLLRRTQGNRTAASRILGVSYPTIMKKITDYKIAIDGRAPAARPRGPRDGKAR